jgi:hypothetical protein
LGDHMLTNAGNSTLQLSTWQGSLRRQNLYLRGFLE